MADPGDKVKVFVPEDIIEGILVQSYEPDIVIVKLDNGYNLGIKKDRVVKIDVIEKKAESKAKSIKMETKKGLPKIAVLHTGGTIASKVDYETGAVEAQFTPEELIQMFPELKEIANLDSRLVRNMLSENMRFAHYNLIAKEIQKEIKKGVAGVIVTHGTDTLHYTSAALSLILEDLPVPVILVGAQRSSDRGSSDAGLNLVCAAKFIINTDFAEVGICMHEGISDDSCVILPGLKTRKFHSSRRDAFKAINTKPWARVDKSGTITYMRSTYRKRNDDAKLKIMPINEELKVGILKIHTNMYATEFLAYKNFDGLVLELTGLGHAPIENYDEYTKEHLKIKKAIEDVAEKTIVVAAPQTIYGRLDMDVYSPGRELQKSGVLGHMSDMTVETTFIKLAWLLSNFKKDDVKKMIGQNLKGEITERIEESTFLT